MLASFLAHVGGLGGALVLIFVMVGMLSIVLWYTVQSRRRETEEAERVSGEPPPPVD